MNEFRTQFYNFEKFNGYLYRNSTKKIIVPTDVTDYMQHIAYTAYLANKTAFFPV